MNIQKKRKFIEIVEVFGYGCAAGTGISMVKDYRSGGSPESEIAAWLGLLGMGISVALIYQIEVSMYGFSPTFKAVFGK